MCNFNRKLDCASFRFSGVRKGSALRPSTVLRYSIRLSGSNRLTKRRIIRICISERGAPICACPLGGLITFGGMGLTSNRGGGISFAVTPQRLSI